MDWELRVYWHTEHPWAIAGEDMIGKLDERHVDSGISDVLGFIGFVRAALE
jgi:hypothetical protein